MSPSAFTPATDKKSQSPTQPGFLTRAATVDGIFRKKTPKPIDTQPKPTRMLSEPTISPVSPRSPTSPRPLLAQRRKTSGTTKHCGRHSNEWLFGGFSVRETVKNLVKEKEEKEQEDK